MSEENKVLVRRLFDAINEGNVVAIDQLLASNYALHLASNPPMDREAFKQGVIASEAAFPDVRFTLEDLIAEGDKVAARVTMRGTHRGNFMGASPTGKQVTMTGMDIFRFMAGKVVGHWGNEDDLGLMQQLGVISVPGGTGA